MRYGTIKRCNNIKVSEIALGCEGFLGKSAGEFKAMLDRAMELGINFIDMYTPNPDFTETACIAGIALPAPWESMWRTSINI